MNKLKFNGKLYPFQQDVLKWCEQTKKGIIGLDMGLGKTVITIAMICKQNYNKTIIVLPLQILEQWKEALLKFTNLNKHDICIYQGRNRNNRMIQNYRIVLTTYDIIRKDMADSDSMLRRSRNIYDCIVFDEAHKLRNHKTNTYTNCYTLCHPIPNKWLLTGTTIHNRFMDFTNLCQFIDINETSDVQTWKNKYYYRLLKTNSNIKFPVKILHEHLLDLNAEHAKIYQQIYECSIGSPMTLVKILRLRQCCNHMDTIWGNDSTVVSSSPKFAKTLEIIKQAPKDDKIIIFSQWSSCLKLLNDYLNQNNIDCLTYNGSLNISKRNQIIEEFKNGHQQILLITITSGGVGLDMSFANHVIILDSWWNKPLEEQAIDRVYRIGQTKDVHVHRLYMNNTIETWMINLKQEKHEINNCFHKDLLYTIDYHKLYDVLHNFI